MSILPNHNFNEFEKVSNFLSHWQEEHIELSFWDFLILHYSNTKHHEEEHESLPFHSLQNFSINHFLLNILAFNFSGIFSLEGGWLSEYKERIYSY